MITQKHSNATVFFEADAQAAYHQVLLHPDSQEIAAINVPGVGLLKPTRMLMGLKNSGAVLQQVISQTPRCPRSHLRF